MFTPPATATATTNQPFDPNFYSVERRLHNIECIQLEFVSFFLFLSLSLFVFSPFLSPFICSIASPCCPRCSLTVFVYCQEFPHFYVL